METYVWQIVFCVVSGAVGWFFSKKQTRREQKQTDLEIINSSIKPLLESIADLTARLKEVTTQLLTAQEENMTLRLEKNELLGKIDNLEQQVRRLSELLNNYTNDETTENPAPVAPAAPAPADLVRPGKAQRRNKR